MKYILKLSVFIFLTIGSVACSSTPLAEKPDVQTRLKLSDAGTVLRQTCGSYGCDDTLRSRCNGSDFRILNQDTRNKYNSKKNEVTGGFDTSRTESVNVVFKCVENSDSPIETK